MIGTVEKTLELAASPERVWRAITDPGELSRWFPDRVDGGQLRPGAEGGWFWENHGRYAFRVEVMEPPTRLVWRWARDPNTTLEDGVTTIVEWLLESTPDGGTLLKLCESGFVLEKDRQVNDGGWDAELSELVALLNAEVNVPG
jgi:uncharacterized protein YndB with AHSA1/START domain